MADPAKIEPALQRSGELGLWVHSRLDGLRLSKFSQEDASQRKRARIAGGCLHTAIEHSQAIVLLISEGMFGSALALVRLLFEAWIRGLWILRAASDDEVDRAGDDSFPRDFGYLIDKLESAGGAVEAGMLSAVKAENWTALNSWTHTGFRQVGARFTPSGLGSGYKDEEVTSALDWADGVSLMIVVEFARIAEDEGLAMEALEQMRGRFSGFAPNADSPPPQ